LNARVESAIDKAHILRLDYTDVRPPRSAGDGGTWNHPGKRARKSALKSGSDVETVFSKWGT